MAKRIKNILFAAALLSSSSFTLQAQSQHANEFTVSLGAGNSGLQYQLQGGKSKSGFGWGAGMGFFHYFSRKFGVSIGLETGMFSSSVDINDAANHYEQPIETPSGLSGDFFLKTNYTGLNEKQTATMLQIPIMLQFQFPVSRKSFLFLGTGIKAGFPVSSKWEQHTDNLTITGYSYYTEQEYANMPDHGFTTYTDLNASGKLELKSPVFFALEGGLKFSVGQGKYLYTGIYWDTGINDINKIPVNTPPLEYNIASPANYNYKSILTEKINPIVFGIKIKMGFGMGGVKEPKPEPAWGWE